MDIFLVKKKKYLILLIYLLLILLFFNYQIIFNLNILILIAILITGILSDVVKNFSPRLRLFIQFILKDL